MVGLIVWIAAMIFMLARFFISDLISRDGMTIRRTILKHGTTYGTIVAMFVLLWGVLEK